MISILLTNIFQALGPQFIGKAVDAISQRASLATISLFSFGFLGIVIVEGIFRFYNRQTIIVTSRKIEYDLRNRFYAHLEKLSLSFFQNWKTGDIMSRGTNDLAAVRELFGPGIMYTANTILTLLIVLPILFLTDAELTLYTLLPVPLIAIIIYVVGKEIHVRSRRIQEQLSAISAKAQENLSGIRVVKAYVQEENEIKHFEKLTWEYLKRNLSLVRVRGIMFPAVGLLVGMGIVAVLYIGGQHVIQGKITIGDFSKFNVYLIMLIWPSIAIGWVMGLFQRGTAALIRMNEILSTEPAIQDNDQTDISIRQIEGEIEFNNLTFSYGPKLSPVLKNVNLKIKKGMTLAIVGKTGSGKSTLVSLIPRLYDAPEDSIRIDGIFIRQIPLAVLRKNIGMVPQETFLFSETVADNISFGLEQATPAQVEKATVMSQLYENIQEFPEKFDTMVGERGITLSGGQKQRAAISRAIIRDPKILILDDALSSVDTYTEDEILKRLRVVMRDRTSIIVAHRISTVKDADLIIVLDNGEIVERGNHEELLARGGLYADLYERQLLQEEIEEI